MMIAINEYFAIESENGRDRKKKMIQQCFHFIFSPFFSSNNDDGGGGDKMF